MIQWIEYGLLRILVGIFSLLPFPILTTLSRIIYCLLYYLIGYRKTVVLQNIKIAFPEKTDSEIQIIAKAFYRQFAEVLLETIKGLSMSAEDLKKRYRFLNAEIFEGLQQEGKSAIILGGHFGNWEWGSLSFPLWVSARVVGVYKPIKNWRIEKFLCQRRCRHGLHLRNMNQTGRALIEYKNQASLFVLIADQTPSNLEAAHWIPFFQHTTPFLNGPEKIARKSNYPVYYFDIQRKGSSHYEIIFQLLSEKPVEESPQAITQKYRNALEQSIRQQPEAWLWSHRRWKHARDME